MAMLSFKHLYAQLQSPESMPSKTLRSCKVLCFRDIHFAPVQHTLNVQHVSLRYLKSLIHDNAFQPVSYEPTEYSGTTTIPIVFHSNREHKGIEHIYIGLVVCHEKHSIYMQADILNFVETIEADLKKIHV